MTDDAALSQDDPNQAVVALAQHVLSTLVETYGEAGVDLPERQVIVVGDLVVDGDAGILGVMFGGTHVGPPGNELSTPYMGEQPRSAIFNVELWRPVTTRGGGGARTRAPRADTLSAQAGTAMVDSWLLLEAAYECNNFGDGYVGPGVVASTAPLSPQGGLQGISLDLTIQVP